MTVLDPAGQFVYSTYLGGSARDDLTAFAIDAGGNTYVAGSTGSSNFPTLNAAQPVYQDGLSDCFVAKLDALGGLVYSTYLGGSFREPPSLLVTDVSQNAYLVGSTESVDFPTLNAVQPSYASPGFQDVFVTKLNAAGLLVYSTYLGGDKNDQATKLAVDAVGNAYVAGGTASTSFPTANAVQATFGGGSGFFAADAFVTKLNPAGAFVYSTYLGGSGGDGSGFDLAVDAGGYAYLAGFTSSSDFPTAHALQPALRGGGDAFVTKLNPAGGFVYSTFLGGSGNDGASRVGFDASGNAYVAGFTASIDLPVESPLQATLNGVSDAFVAKLADAPPAAEVVEPVGGDEGSPIAVDGSLSGDDIGIRLYEWDCENDGAFDVSSPSPNGSACTYTDDGAFTLRLRVTDTGDQTAEDTASVTVANVAPTATFANLSGPIIQGQTAVLAFSTPHDPSVDDTLAGFSYSYDCDGNLSFEVAPSAAASHACPYPVAGTFTARGRIEDKDFGSTEYTVAVVVLNPRQGIDLLTQKVNELVAGGSLSPDPAGGLIAKLEAAAQQLDKGKTNPAVNQLAAFINQVEGLVDAGQLPAQDGQMLIGCASQIIAALGA